MYRTDWVGGDWLENPDVDFLRELTAELESLYNVDRTRIFASGHSRGAAMSIILAFTLPGTIAGFLSEMGFIEPNRYYQEIDAWDGERRIPAVLVAGTWDQDVPVDNADLIAEVLTDGGWVADRDFTYHRLEDVAHEWQPQLNQDAWDFLSERPLPAEEAAP